MKTKVVFLQCMILSIVVFGQIEGQKTLPETEVIPPKFPAVETTWNWKKIQSIDDYLRANIEYPEKALNEGYYGTEVVQFVVTPAGELADFKVINSVCREIDEEVIGVLKSTNGSWKPASVNTEPVPMVKEVSVVFKLKGTYDFVSMAKRFLNSGNKKFFLKKNPKKALKYYNRGIALLPNQYTLLVARGMCRFELGNEEGAIRDWNRIKTLSDSDNNHLETIYLADDFRKFKGYSEMLKLTQK